MIPGMKRLFLLLLILSACVPMGITAGTIPPITQIRRILFFGNSLTMHPPYPEKSWAGYWGMAATQPDRDYVHRLQLYITGRQGVVPEIKVIRSDLPWFPDSAGREVTRFDPDLVVVQMGNNATGAESVDQWRADFHLIAQGAQATGAMIIVVGLWDVAEDDPREVNARLMAEELQAPFVPIRDMYSIDTSAQTDGPCPDAGVCWHPGDAGMSLIAWRIYNVLYGETIYVPFAMRAEH